MDDLPYRQPIWISLPYAFSKLDLSCQTHAEVAEGAEVADASRWSQLPPELIVMIAGMLKVQYAACLALCSRRLSRLLGPSVWASVRYGPCGSWLEFLSSLAKDDLRYFVCEHCMCLHLSSGIQWPNTIFYDQLRCMHESRAYSPGSSWLYKVHYPQIHLAMKQYYCDTYIGYPLEAFQHTEVEHDGVNEVVNLLSIDVQIVCNEFLMRSQSWTLLPRDRSIEFIRKRLLHDACQHTGKENLKLINLRNSRLNQSEHGKDYRTKTLQCSHCCMDYILDMTDFGERGLAVLVTRWVNFGAGLSPKDPKWLSHLNEGMPSGVVYQPHSLGSIRVAFEDQAELPLDDLISKNTLKMFSKRNRKRYTRGSDGFVWKWGRSRWWFLEPSIQASLPS